MNVTPEQLEKVIKGCVAGDRKCQEEVFRLFFGKMMGVCLRYTRDRDTAQDMLQDAFIKAFEKIGDYSSTGSFEGWLRRIVSNTAIDHFRKNKNLILIEDDSLVGSDDDENESAAESDNDDSLYDNIRPEMILEAMHQLSPAYRTVFNLYVYENRSHKEIAEILNISIGTSKSNFAKAKMKLKVLLQKHLTFKEG